MLSLRPFPKPSNLFPGLLANARPTKAPTHLGQLCRQGNRRLRGDDLPRQFWRENRTHQPSFRTAGLQWGILFGGPPCNFTLKRRHNATLHHPSPDGKCFHKPQKADKTSPPSTLSPWTARSPLPPSTPGSLLPGAIAFRSTPPHSQATRSTRKTTSATAFSE
jgi:hypothetical protein